MRKDADEFLNKRRIKQGDYASPDSFGLTGAFWIKRKGAKMFVMSSDGSNWVESGLSGNPWEHVSVSLQNRCPTWEEMDYIKALFWDDDELVLQFHVPRNQHINVSNFCLHLWKPIGVEIPLPPTATV